MGGTKKKAAAAAKAPPRTSVMVNFALAERLRRLALDLSAAEGKRLSSAEVLERALDALERGARRR